MGASVRTDRVAEVWARLGEVTDPELDEPVTDLGFVETVAVDGEGGVDVVFRLPTYWCSANFAFLMADDMRLAVSSLPWVRAVRPQLQDHMVAAEINRGVRLGQSFAEALKDFAAGETLDEVREKFRRKAFERRQEAVILALRAAGHDDAAICGMSLAAFDRADLGEAEGGYQKPRYRALLVARGLAGERAFVTYNGRPIAPHELPAYLQRLRAVRINMEFNSVLCRGLLDARYKEIDADFGLACGSGCTRHAPADAIRESA
ncbi:metal-sulfur cluster assembly factor [Labrys monachus]|uniref:Metal-sulfur cluster biosynthetic enzyme n=1 Tax=Labrys monachus TaxID=217067 RepID=A0ABU0FBJ8_9HYPH|nr:iron-sulfur cluster assembly protein [Labrys monachus]MDQ0391926.1 metal-sulfur cluster biosynthetic enzyme [Labrys monachus]